MLSQLSYDPKYSKNKATRMGIEPTTSAVTGRRSNQLSHRALFIKDIPSKQHTRIFLHLLHFSLLWLKPRPISNSQLHTLPYFHLCPIYLVVFKGSYYLSVWEILSLGGFTLRCLQRLSLPDLATLLCTWQYNRYTSGPSIPVLSY